MLPSRNHLWEPSDRRSTVGLPGRREHSLVLNDGDFTEGHQPGSVLIQPRSPALELAQSRQVGFTGLKFRQVDATNHEKGSWVKGGCS